MYFLFLSSSSDTKLAIQDSLSAVLSPIELAPVLLLLYDLRYLLVVSEGPVSPEPFKNEGLSNPGRCLRD